MNPQEWLAATSTWEMLKPLPRWKGSLRRRRLLACACCRRIWPYLPISWQPAIEVAELYADGQAKERDMLAIRPMDPGNRRYAEMAASWASERSALLNGDNFHGLFQYAAQAVIGSVPGARYGEELHAQAALVRDIFAVLREEEPVFIVAPWKCTIDPTTLTPAIVSLGRAAHDERHLPSGELDPQRLAVLADAVEESGAPGELVTHLRSPGPHVRGCHAVDLVLGQT